MSRLGLADEDTAMGAIELLAKEVKKSSELIAEAIKQLTN
jgi:hypothetical protein